MTDKLTERKYLDFIMYHLDRDVIVVPLFGYENGEVHEYKIGVVATMDVQVKEVASYTRMVKLLLKFYKYSREVNFYVNLNHSPREARHRFFSLIKYAVWESLLENNEQEYVVRLNSEEKRKRMNDLMQGWQGPSGDPGQGSG